MKKDLLLKIILVLAILGFADSYYLLGMHNNTTDAVFCDLNEKFNCHMVNQSEYSSFLGIPVAFLGILGYAVIGLLAWILLMKRKELKRFVTEKNLFIISVLGLLFALYLTAMEAFVIHFYCVFCLISQAIILLIAMFAYKTIK